MGVNPAPLTVGPAETVLVLDVVSWSGQSPVPACPDGGLIVGVNIGEPLLEGGVAIVIASEDPLRLGGRISLTGQQIERPDTHSRRLERQTQSLLAFPQCRFDALSVGDILDDAQIVLRFAVGARQ